MKRKQDELYQKHQEKLRKKQEIINRRRKAEQVKQEKERKRYLKLLKKREENDRKFEMEQAKKDKKRQEMLHQRVKEFHTKIAEKEQNEQIAERKQCEKMNNIAQRYGKEDERYIAAMKDRIKGVQSNYNQRKERHAAGHLEHKKQLAAKHDALLKQQQANEERLKQFQIQKAEELRQKKAKRDKKMKKLVATMKKQAAIDAAKRQAKAIEFKNEQLMLKNQREDNRRIKDLNLKQQLRQQRMMNDTAVKLRQNELKEEIMEANKKGDVDKLNALIQELEVTSESKPATVMGTPRGKKLGKVSVTLSPQKIDSSIAKTSQINATKMKASIYRSTA